MIKPEISKCPVCGGKKIVLDESRGQVICTQCGVVLVQNCIDHGAEWRCYNREQYKNKTRVGPKTFLSLHDKGLTTNIGKENRDGFGKKLTPEKTSIMFRLRKWQERTKTADTKLRNLSNAMSALDRASSLLGLNKNIKESAAYYYRKIARNGLKGRSIEQMVLAIIYLVLKKNKNIALLKKYSNLPQVDFKYLHRNIKLIQNELNIKLQPTKPQELIRMYCSELSLSWQVGTDAIKLLDHLENLMNFSGRNPKSIACAALYFSCNRNNERRSQKEISRVAGITEVTIRQNYKKMKDIIT